MDERVEKAFAVANYMATLSNQRRIILEEFNQKLIYYINGATFKITPNLITFTKTVIDLGHTSDMPFVDSNNLPVIINDVEKFLNDIMDTYFQAVNKFATDYNSIKRQRKVEDIVSL